MTAFEDKIKADREYLHSLLDNSGSKDKPRMQMQWQTHSNTKEYKFDKFEEADLAQFIEILTHEEYNETYWYWEKDKLLHQFKSALPVIDESVAVRMLKIEEEKDGASLFYEEYQYDRVTFLLIATSVFYLEELIRKGLIKGRL